MKIISILIGLVLVALFVMKQLNSGSSRNNIEEVIDKENINTPKVPTSPKDIQKFEKDINKYIQDTTEKKTKELTSSSVDVQPNP